MVWPGECDVELVLRLVEAFVWPAVEWLVDAEVWLLVALLWLLVVGPWLLVVGPWLLVALLWLLVVGPWLVEPCECCVEGPLELELDDECEGADDECEGADDECEGVELDRFWAQASGTIIKIRNRSQFCRKFVLFKLIAVSLLCATLSLHLVFSGSETYHT